MCPPAPTIFKMEDYDISQYYQTFVIQRNIYQEHNASPYLKRIKDDCHFKWYQFGQTIQLSETHVVNTCWVSIFYLHILKNELLKQVQI